MNAVIRFVRQPNYKSLRFTSAKRGSTLLSKKMSCYGLHYASFFE
jgi:hypothetical protein